MVQEEVLEVVQEDLETILVEGLVETEITFKEENLLKNTKQLVLNVVRNVKFRSNQHKENQFTALNVSKKKTQDLQEEILINFSKGQNLFLFFIKF